MRVKICGVMRAEDAAEASRAGADAVGMIFHPPARRNIDVDNARGIVAAAGPFVTAVGVFVDASRDVILRTAQAARIGVVQLHGHETAELVAALGDAGLRVLKVVRVDEQLEKTLVFWRSAAGQLPALAGIVLETAGTGGGSGVANDWARVARAQAAGAFAGLPPLIAAGGLDPGTVFGVIESIRPWAVDVSSGVEETLGRKSPQKIAKFIAEARRAGGQ